LTARINVPQLVGQALGKNSYKETEPVARNLRNIWKNYCADESGQDIAEYAVMLAVILVIVVGTIRLIGSQANNVFSNVGSSIQ
jgi:Flp pilus assembly pilin Flp